MATITSTLGGIHDLSLSGDGFTLCAAVSSGVALLYDLRTLQAVGSLTTADGSGVARCAFQSVSGKASRNALVASYPEDGTGSHSIPIPLRNSQGIPTIGSGLQVPQNDSPIFSSPIFSSLSPRLSGLEEFQLTRNDSAEESLATVKKDITKKMETLHEELVDKIQTQNVSDILFVLLFFCTYSP